MMQLAHRIQSVEPSPTLALSTQAQKLKAAGADIINLSVGEPHLNTPHPIHQAAIQALANHQTRYTPVGGYASLKTAILNKLKRDHQLSYTSEQILVSCGAKHSIFNALQVLINPGDEVIIPAPYWVSYPQMVRLCGGIPRILPTRMQQRFILQPDDLAQAITPQTRVLILNSPGNPSGMAYNSEHLQRLGDLLKQHPHIMILSDDIYEKMLWSPHPFSNLAMACPELIPQTIIINGVSKAYAMTGWRIGYAAGPKDAIRAMHTLQSHSTSNPCSIAQAAAQAALTGDQTCLEVMAQTLRQCHDICFEALNNLEEIDCLPADGAFYLFPAVHKLLEKKGLQNDYDLAEKLLKEHGLAMVPGSAFGCPAHLRLSYALSPVDLQSAMDRFRRYVTEPV